MLDLAEYLLQKAQNSDEPIPVLMNLSSWASKQQSISDWLAEELKVKYKLKINTAKKFLEDEKLIPLFDSLDEVKNDLQKACIEALNNEFQVTIETLSPVNF